MLGLAEILTRTYTLSVVCHNMHMLDFHVIWHWIILGKIMSWFSPNNTILLSQ